MTFNSATGGSFKNILEQVLFLFEVEELAQQQKTISIEILPIELLIIVRQMLVTCDYTQNTGGVLPIEKVHEIYQKLEKAFELPTTIKQVIDRKWERLGIQNLNMEDNN